MARAKSFGEQYHVPYYESISEMFAQQDIDVVNVLTPSGLHAKNTIERNFCIGKL